MMTARPFKKAMGFSLFLVPVLLYVAALSFLRARDVLGMDPVTAAASAVFSFLAMALFLYLPFLAVAYLAIRAWQWLHPDPPVK